LSYGTVHAQIKGNPTINGSPAQQQTATPKASSTLSPDLKNLYDRYGPRAKVAESTTGKPLPSNDPMNKYMQIKGNTVVVDITVKEDINTAKAQLQKIGLQITGIYGRVISGIISINSLPQLEAATAIRYVRPAYKPMHQSVYVPNPGGGTRITPVISQGDTAMQSYIARKKYNVSGKGTKVGVLSDSYNNLGTAQVGVLHGELPGTGNPFNYKKPVQVLQDLDSGGTDEGRAMLEIVHDVAPGADLAFHTADLGQANFAQGIIDLQKAGCNVIADDVFYYTEPFFQDGIVAQAVDQVKSAGTTYVSSAGNQSVRSYESVFRDSAVLPLGPGFGTGHNFSGPGDVPRYYQPIYIPPGGSIITSFQWDESSFTASGVGCNSDLDMYLLDINGNIVAAGASDNLASGDPIEAFGYSNNTANYTFFLVIVKYAGPDPQHVKYILYNDALFYLTSPAIPGILSPTLVGHAKANGAIATGAAYFLNTPPYGVDTPLVEGFSSVGGVANYYDIEGNRIAPLVRKKPEVVAPDGVFTSFFNPFGEPVPPGSYPQFFGTSAAAPHAAGVAALMIEAEKLKTITPDQIKGVLSANTWHMENLYPAGYTTDFNFNTGYGFIRADKAVGVVKFPNVYIKDLRLTAICSDNPGTTRNWKVSNPNPFPVEADWQLIGASQHGSILVQPGDTTFSTPAQYFRNTALPSIVILDWQDNFEFPRFDLAYSTRAVCGKDAVSEINSDRTISGQANVFPGSGAATDLAPGKGAIASVYPNPSPGIFKLYLSMPGQGSTNVELFSTDGKRLQAQRVAQTNGVIDVDASGYRPGIYLLKVSQEGFEKTIKLIKQ
jgi:hypothetical protein